MQIVKKSEGGIHKEMWVDGQIMLFLLRFNSDSGGRERKQSKNSFPNYPFPLSLFSLCLPSVPRGDCVI